MKSQPVVIRILIVDEDPLHRSRIAALVNAKAEMTLIAEASSGRVGIDLDRRLRPDVTLMDLQMQDMNRAQAISEIPGEVPDARIIMLTTYQGECSYFEGAESGRAYLQTRGTRIS